MRDVVKGAILGCISSRNITGILEIEKVLYLQDGHLKNDCHKGQEKQEGTKRAKRESEAGGKYLNVDN